MSQYYEELSVWPARMDSLCALTFYIIENDEHAVTFLFTCHAVLGLGEFGLSV
jgi:hypothetical protein